MKKRNLKRKSLPFLYPVEKMESRLFLSATANATPAFGHFVANPIVGANQATPQGYSSPAGVPITPALMRNAYGLGTYGSSNVVFNTSQGTFQGDGQGQTIAIIAAGADPNIISDLTNFDSYYNLPDPPSIQQLNQNGGTSLTTGNSGVIGEMCLDVDWAHVMAPKANIILYTGGNIYTCMQTAAANPSVSVISVSYTTPGTQPADSFFATPSSRGTNGVTYMAATGDTGGEVDYPSASGAVVAVGGTSLYMSGNSYSSEIAWSDGGGGINVSVAQPAYQKGAVGTTSTTYRVEPDIALDADPTTGVAIYDSYDNGTATPWGAVYGGTSLSTPVFAGILAVVDEGRLKMGLTSLDGATQTLPRLYALSNANYALNYHDVTSGNNSHPATAGYDLATGLGSPKGSAFYYDLAGGSTVTGRAFVDKNGNGVYDGSDTPIANTQLYIDVKNTGVQVASDPTATTDANGNYTFSDLIGSESGTIRLVNTLTGYIHSTAQVAVNTAYNSTQTINIAFETNPYTAVANPSSVTGATTQLSLTGTNPPGSSGFTYTWAATTVPSGATPSFSVNGTNAASTTTVTFNATGSYVFTVTINDGQKATTTTTVNVTVVPTTVVQVSPTTAAVADAQTQTFTAVAYDQFGNVLPTQPSFTWSIVGSPVGTINPTTGLYTAPAAGPGTDTVQATTNGFSGTATVTDQFTRILGTANADTIRLVRSGANLLVFENNAATPLYNTSFASVSSLTIGGKGGADSINIDYSGGASPVPLYGLTVNEPPTATATMIITGTTGDDTAAITNLYLTFNGDVISYNSITSIVFNGNGGTDSLTQTGQPAAAVVFNGGTSGGTSATDTLNVMSGSYTFPAATAGGGVKPLSLAALNLSGTAVVIPSAASHSDRWALTVGALNINSGYLDLGDNDMIVHNANVSDIYGQIQTGYANGAWNGPGIESSAAATDSTLLTTLGVISNNDGTGAALNASFDGQPVSASDVLVKYTYYGDANLDGKVDGTDYSRIDSATLTGATGWFNGDFNYDGVLNGSDYTLIDNGFNSQGVSLAASVATLAQTSVTGVASSKSSRLTAIAATPAALFASKPITADSSDSVWSQLWKKDSKIPAVLA